jgi:outer membrane protein assembly factor BamD
MKFSQNYMKNKRFFSVFVALLCAFPLVGCESLGALNIFDRTEKYKPEIIPDVPAEKLYNEGLAHATNQNYESAAKKFDIVNRYHPNSLWGKKAVVMTAYAYYEAAQYDDAISAAKRYLALNPNGPEAAYAQYILAMSYFNQIPDVTRDQERTERAILAMRELLQRYPNSEYAKDTREKLLVASDMLAGKEMQVGKHYLDKRNYTGAINRYREVVSKYQNTRHVEEALMRLTEAYFAVGVVGEAQTAAAVLGHNFPDSPWYRDAYALLKTRGLEPREDKGSWISRAFQSVTGLKIGGL